MTTNSEFKERRARWIAALRSGKYPQTTDALKNEDGYCCLGVACEVAGVQPTDTSYSYMYDGRESDLPPSVVEFYGFTSECGRFDEPYQDNSSYRSLVDLNDILNLTFDEIADFVETNPKGLFVE